MAKRRGFFAELQHLAKMAEAQQQRQLAQQNRQAVAAARAAEATRNRAARAAAAAQRADATEKKRFDKEAQAAYNESRFAEVEAMNAELNQVYEELDAILSVTLDVDDFVDLETLRVKVEHPSFQHDDLRQPVPQPEPISEPPAPAPPVVVPPSGIFGKKKKLEEAQNAAAAEHAKAMVVWREQVSQTHVERQKQLEQWRVKDDNRIKHLEEQLAAYENECAVREQQANKQNAKLDALINNLAYGVPEAVQDYVEIVLSNSIYPEMFPVQVTAEFNADNAELLMRVVVPSPDVIPTVKEYKYQKAIDEIVPVQLTQKAVKDRYASIIHKVALRNIHEVFEADRGLVQAISLELGAESIIPATGKPAYVPFVAVATTRDAFEDLNLSAVMPEATLAHLEAAISKNPVGLVPISSSGVRRAK